MTIASASKSYDALAANLRASGYVSDPWIEGMPRFRQTPVLLSPEVRDALYACAEAVAFVYNELCLICHSDSTWLETFFGLTPWQRAMWEASTPAWHGIARADVFLVNPEDVRNAGTCKSGMAVCELNSDTPSGEAEAVILNSLVHQDYADYLDPNVGLERALCDAMALYHRLTTGQERKALQLGLVYPTEMTEDLSMVLLYRDWFEARGHRVVLGSPFNLGRMAGGMVGMFGEPCDVIVRHYKTDWWGERCPVWSDSPPFADAEPLREPLGLLIEASQHGSCAVWNPFGSVLAQNKKSMAFMWEHRNLFSKEAQDIIDRHIPLTLRLQSAQREELRAHPNQWVLKSDYGCEGEEVVMGAAVDGKVWEQSLELATPGRWVVQRCFHPVADEEGKSVNYGVYLVAGHAAGIFSRVECGMTDTFALSAPTFVLP